MNKIELAKTIDHTILRANATDEEIVNLCEEAKKYGFASVCVNPCHVERAYEILKDTEVCVCTVVGFPLGATTTAVKVFEAKEAVKNGAKEVDMVINVGAVKGGNLKTVEDEIKAVVSTTKEANPLAIVKVIIETCLLTEQEKNDICQMLLKTGADFVKTSTGFSTGGATVGDIALFKRIVGDKMKIKASGGIKTYDDIVEMVNAGADRIGTSGAVAIMTNA